MQTSRNTTITPGVVTTIFERFSHNRVIKIVVDIVGYSAFECLIKQINGVAHYSIYGKIGDNSLFPIDINIINDLLTVTMNNNSSLSTNVTVNAIVDSSILVNVYK